MLKKDARRQFREKRLLLSQQELMKLDDLLLIQFQSLELPFIDSLLSFWPIEENNEPDTHLFTEFLKFRNPEVKVCYPISDIDKMEMEAMITDVDTPFIKSKWNIMEPQGQLIVPAAEIDLAFVPLLAFDKRGYRAGYGKGFYDKFLSRCKPDCLKVGFSYFEPVDLLEDSDEFDVPLDVCVTPVEVYVF